MELLEILGRRHSEWCRMVRSFGCQEHVVEDLVQEMYLRLYKYVKTPERIMYNETEINTYFVYVTLHNMFREYSKSKSRMVLTNEIPETAEDHDPVPQERRREDLVEKIWEEVGQWHWYDEKLFTLYMTSDMSMRKLSSETKISLRSIFNTIRNGKKRIQEQCNRDYEAYQNSSKGSW
jgi:RNA polymerase sigma factor (sigma-70 family)